MTRPLIHRTAQKAETPQERSVRALVEEVRRGRRVNALPLVECDPQSDEQSGRKLEHYLKGTVEPDFRDLSEAAEVDGSGFQYVVGLMDKSQQNPINKLGGMAAGDQSMRAYWDTAANATWDMAAINGSEDIGLHLTRVAPRSDEGIIVMGGITRDEPVDVQFRVSWDVERKEISLRDYDYVVEVLNGSSTKVQYKLDLEALSKVLNYEGMVVACDFKLSDPKVVSTQRGFILEEIRKLENSEVEFYDKLQPLYNGNGGLAEVRTPFKNSLTSRGQEKTSGGCFVEIKFRIPQLHVEGPVQSGQRMPGYRDVIMDKRGADGVLIERGTRKGLSEINSGVGGMRFLNTFGGKSRANRVLSPTAQAMGDLDGITSVLAPGEKGLTVLPVSGSYLQYWLDEPPSPVLKETIQRALSKRLSAARGDDPGYLELHLQPVVTLIDAANMRISDVRAAFILKSLGRGFAPVESLDKADFIVNFNEHVREPVKRSIFEDLVRQENGGVRVRLSDIQMLEAISRICKIKERAVRDTEDLIWTLRVDPELPSDISKKRDEIEKWFFDFSWERADKIFKLLTQTIDKIIKNGYKLN